MERDAIIDLMVSRNLFDGANADIIGKLVDHAEVVTTAAGERLIEQGKISEAVWILLEGEVLIIVNDEPSHQLNTPGTILGEISAVSRLAATATVKAVSNLTALCISHSAFHKALSDSDHLASSVLRSMSKYLG